MKIYHELFFPVLLQLLVPATSMERTPHGRKAAIKTAAAMGNTALVAKGRATATPTLNALALWCVAMTTALGATEMTVAYSHKR